MRSAIAHPVVALVFFTRDVLGVQKARSLFSEDPQIFFLHTYRTMGRSVALDRADGVGLYDRLCIIVLLYYHPGGSATYDTSVQTVVEE